MVKWSIKHTIGLVLMLAIATSGYALKHSSKLGADLAPMAYRSLHWSNTPEALWSKLEQALSTEGDLNFRLWKERPSLTAVHRYYEILKDGVPIENALLSLHYHTDGSVRADLPSLPGEAAKTGDWSPPKAMDWCREFRAQGDWVLDQAPQRRWFPSAQGLTKGYLLKAHQAEGAYFHFYGNGVDLWQVVDQRMYNSDTPIRGLVFYPDPLTSANVFYGGLYTDQNDQDDPVLNSERQNVVSFGSYSGGQFRLENEHLKILDFSAPNISPVTSNNGQFNYTRSQNGFEDFNTFYHISRFKQYTDSLGFEQVADYAVEVDPHALSNADQSFYIHAEKRVYLGEGGVDDAEDADVIVHEYGHAFINDAIPSLGSAINERAAMEEALCDFFAYSYSAALNQNQDDRVFNWDGHNEFWPGRNVTSSKDYTTLSFAGSIYQHTDILVSCLREIQQNSDREVATSLVVEALFRCNPNTTYRWFAEKVLEVEQLLYGGQYYGVVRAAFVRRSILPADVGIAELSAQSPKIELFGTLEFSKGGRATLRSEQKLHSYQLMNVKGQVLRRASLRQAQRLELDGTDLKTGLYLLQVTDVNGQTYHFKLIRAH